MKKIVKLLILLKAVLAKHFTLGDSSPLSCPKYQCAELSNRCTKSEQGIIYTSECPKNFFCANGLCTSSLLKYEDTESYPGEKCSTETPCKSGACSQGFCKGKAVGEKCRSISECDPGLRCHHTCKPVFQLKERGCLSDFDCTSNSGCNFGECTKYFSLPAGEKIEKCENFSSFLCGSAMCDKGKCIRGQYLNEFPKECRSNNDCASQDGYFTVCLCGANSDGKSFCLPFPADGVGMDYFESLEEWTGSSAIGLCNSSRRFSAGCMKSRWSSCGMAGYLFKAYRYQFFPVIIENESCVERSVTQDYWEIRDEFKNGKECRLFSE